LGENESATVGIGPQRAVKVVREAARSNASVFARQMPRRVRIKLFSTGVGLKEGEADPHWQVVARSDDRNFKRRTAVVTAAAPLGRWLPNDARSQWISTDNGPPNLPNGVTYSFRTTFELVDALPDTAVLWGKFIADNRVKAIRLNGKEVSVPQHDDIPFAPFDHFTEFSVRMGFVEGSNTLEFDVSNGIPAESEENGPMGLRIELSGSVFSGQAGDHWSPERR
jgi:hypothetical protein